MEILLFSGFQLLSYCRQRSSSYSEIGEPETRQLLEEVIVGRPEFPELGVFRSVIVPNGKQLFGARNLELRYSIEVELHFSHGHYVLAYIYMTSDYEFKLYIPRITESIGQIGRLLEPDRTKCFDNFLHTMLNRTRFIEYDRLFICYERKYKNL